MRYKKKYTDRKYDPIKVEVYESKPAGSPSKPTSDSGPYSRKPFKGLKLGESITVKANPYQDAAKQSLPYNVVGSNAPTIDVDYGTDENLAGNILTQVLSDQNSTLLQTFDAFQMEISAKYRHVDTCQVTITRANGKVSSVSVKNVGNTAYNLELVKAMDDAISKGYAETFTQLPIMTSLEVRTPKKEYVSNEVTFTVYSGLVDLPEVGDEAPEQLTYPGTAGLLVLLLTYQIYLQQIHLSLSKYNKLMAMEQHLKDMSFNRDDVTLNQIYGLLKKSSLVSNLKGLAATVKGEYLDLDWLPKVAKFALIPSRRSAGMTDPLLDIRANYSVAPIVFSMGEFEADTSEWFNGLTHLGNRFEPVSILIKARQMNNGNPDNLTPNLVFNEVSENIDDVVAASYVFKSEVTELRTLLDVFSRVGLTRWKKGAVINIMTNPPQYTPVYNVTVHDFYRAAYSGNPELSYNSLTKRWQIVSLWNKYTGIPQFERFYNGQQLIFSTKQFPTDTNDPGHTGYKYLVPQLFKLNEEYGYIIMCNRLGEVLPVYESQPTTIVDASHTSRLDLLKQGMKLAFPQTEVAADAYLAHSHALAALESVFGISGVKVTGGSLLVNVSSDLIGFVDVELEPTANEMIAYAKHFGPFNVYRD